MFRFLGIILVREDVRMLPTLGGIDLKSLIFKQF